MHPSRDLIIPYHPAAVPQSSRYVIGVSLILAAVLACIAGEKVPMDDRGVLIARGVALILVVLGWSFLVHFQTLFDFRAQRIRRQRLLFGRWHLTERSMDMGLITGLKVERSRSVGSECESDTVWLYLMRNGGAGLVLAYYNVTPRRFAAEAATAVERIERATRLSVDGRELLRGSD